MNVELQINNSTAPDAGFLSWSPSPCRIRVTNPSGVDTPTVNVKISGVSAASGGAVEFRSGAAGAFSGSLTLTVPLDGTSVPFFAAGKFGQPSVNDGDVRIEARLGTTLVGSAPVMVRIRKNAEALTAGERDRFVSAFAKLNNQGLGRFADFRNMHVTNVSLPQAHGAPGFLPWHRAYLLDLERGLQAIDPSVALPYWRFDQPAPNIFKLDFFGASDALGTVKFSATNPLQFWKTDGVQGINRRPHFSIAGAPPGLLTEAQTLGIGSTFSIPEHGRQSARICAYEFWRLHSGSRQRPQRIRCSSCFTAMWIDCGRNGSARMAASIRRWRRPSTATLRASPAINCPTPCGRGTALPVAHGLRRHPAARWPHLRVSPRRDCSRALKTAWIITASSMLHRTWDSIMMMSSYSAPGTRR